MKQPMFSIVIPVYNAEKYLQECLESVVNQTCHDYEAIIIDDGSGDSSGEICDSYARKYEQISVYHKKNAGPMLARKDGILRAHGRYCLFLDADDFYDKRLVEIVRKFLIEEELDLLIFGKYTVYQNKMYAGRLPVKDFSCVGKKRMLSLFMKSDRFNSVYTKAIKRDRILPCLDSLYQDACYAEDMLQSANFIMVSDKIGLLGRNLYYYRIRKGSLVHRQSAVRIRERLQMEKTVIDYINAEGYLTENDKEAYLKKTLNDFMECIYRLNHGKTGGKTDREELRTLRELPFVGELLQKGLIKGIAFYNKPRAYLFMRENYRILILIDYILLAIQTIVLFIKREKGFP